MFEIEVALSPALYPYRTLKNHTAVVVDILRATTAVCAAFAAGAELVVPLTRLEDLEHYRRLGYTLAAERNGKKVEGATCGNSPVEYRGMDLRGQRLAYSTTNGTVAILAAADADRTLTGCFSNIGALAQLLTQKPQDLVILCSGWKQDFSLEDTLFAGELCQMLLDSGLYATHNDAALMAMTLYQQAQPDLYHFCQQASHVARLQRLNYDHDIRFAFLHNTTDCVPRLDKDSLTLTLCH